MHCQTQLCLYVHAYLTLKILAIYAIKKQIIERYTLDKIRERKLYDRQVVTKKDFHDRFFEYRPVGMSPNSH